MDDDSYMVAIVMCAIAAFLKLINYADWSWWVVFSPIILWAVCFLIAIIIITTGETK